MTLSVRKESSTIERGIVGIMGTVSPQANNYTKLIPKITELRIDSAPMHLNTPTITKTKAATIIGAKK